MTTKRIALAGLAVAVLVAVVALILDVTSSTASDESGKRRVAQATGKTNVVDTPVPLTRFGYKAGASDEGEGGDDAGAGAEQTGGGLIEYVKDDGTAVRDHRAETAPLRPRPVSRPTLLKMRNDLRPIVKECGKALRQRDRTQRGKMQADMTVSIRDGRVRIDGLDLQVQGLTDSEYPACVREALEGLELFAADGQADIDKHTMSFPFKVP